MKKFLNWLCHKIWAKELADVAEEKNWSFAMIYIFIVYVIGLISISYWESDFFDKVWQKIKDDRIRKMNEQVVGVTEREMEE